MTKRLSDFDIGLLLTLDALLKHRNVTHAASRLNITQSALSARLTRLRHLLNDPLFTMAASGRGMIPTPRASKTSAACRSPSPAIRRGSGNVISGKGRSSAARCRLPG
ncbi:LysR family transcriptional regulator [Mesorhizobium sp. M7A.F.Ca.CA.001.09.2.1]|uniref:helix-turn-helix domain-containing protein n=2 Tax=Phyllobacteriaceae TaxID=69277 RepID=UPI0009DD326E|nr:LysR family transcriptional regulator [Mesorhizobium sp. M7A.F.Ca.CA.001.13.2.1]RUY67316.1 LysR family transcriptional regulator [Mesorhizobium sp. M7A.F.Ca.CA.001.05.1.1]RUY71121.1 LysR family transcriptional regulator [Mesorhizobium sp. M7A.F.Ca.CA.001.13.1.1]RUY78581.1 LysR family transcriptional regulator [Mesorhizobium sp. M7A.F.Ca.CA.001.09.2.1]RUZ10011.1 LysR family transcriptional regulator [Mesorhizobium sp. M7A.F.Ca.CA.001.04.2.1]RUZ26228.1 LysR family transcriptional regulator [M